MARWEIRREIEPIALTALVLSLLAVGAQLFAWVRGPEVKLLPPDKVALYADMAPEGAAIVRVAAPLSYANLAQQSFGTLVTSERVKLNIGKLQSEQQWNAFGVIEREGASFRTRSTDLAIPQALPGQSFASHFTLFTPVRRNCPANQCNPTADYISPEQLQAAATKAERIHFEFAVATIDGETVTTACDVILHDLSKRLLANLSNSAFYARCRVPEEG